MARGTRARVRLPRDAGGDQSGALTKARCGGRGTSRGETMTAHDFRRLALALTGVVEGAHMGHPHFRVNGRIFATLQADMRRGMVKLTPEQQQEYLRAQPGVFTPAAGAWGRGGSTLVDLAAIDEETLGEALTRARQLAVLTSAVVKKPSAGKTRKR